MKWHLLTLHIILNECQQNKKCFIVFKHNQLFYNYKIRLKYFEHKMKVNRTLYK